MKAYQGPIWPGQPYPLGAKFDGRGVNFAIFSENAEEVTLCLFHEAEDPTEYAQIRLKEYTDHVWHAYVPGLPPGTIYGYRMQGPFDPVHGYRFNPHKLLLDPYAKALTGPLNIQPSMFGYPMESSDEDRHLQLDERDSAADMPKCIVINPGFDWEDDAPPDHEMHNSIIYELNVKGMTALNPHIPENLRGTYAGLAHPQVIQYFKDLGITAIELMPVHHFIHPKTLLDQGLRNYWGYDTIGYFAPHAEYSASGFLGQQVDEFKEMVKAYHKADIEVILDVVYNHTAEGNQYGPTLSFKGVDNHNYYRLMMEDQQYYMDYTGTGNTLNMLNVRSLQLVMDSLRYWVTEMHVDGFRFDLASALARGLYEVGKLSTFLDTIHQDPVISQVKLIAEPWDIGEGGYQVGNFPVLWAEWNGKYRDSVRKFWKGDEAQVAELAYRLSGSSDLYQDNGRLPHASINFVTAHDGFTLHDLVSYNEKHNEANGEGNRDGHEDNLSWNCGAEGPTDDPDIIALREKQKRNFLATLMFSQGLPMLSHGDEYGRSQGGNNNVYCQDNELSWFRWEWSAREQHLLEFTRKLIAIRQQSQVLHRRRYFKGRGIRGKGIEDIRWVDVDGTEMTNEQWDSSYVRCMGMLLNGERMDEVDRYGRRVRDDIFFLMVNSYWEPLSFKLPYRPKGWKWEILIDTSDVDSIYDNQPHHKDTYTLQDRSLVLLRKLK